MTAHIRDRNTLGTELTSDRARADSPASGDDENPPEAGSKPPSPDWHDTKLTRQKPEIRIGRFWWFVFGIGLALPLLLGVKVAFNVPKHNTNVQGYLLYVSVLFAASQIVAMVSYAVAKAARITRALDTFVGLSLILTLALLMELSVATALRLSRGQIHFPYSMVSLLDSKIFFFPRPWEPHMGVVLRPTPHYSGRLGAVKNASHTGGATRTVPGSPAAARQRIALVGGSTTYDSAVDDADTWAAHLQSQLGRDVEVVNFGVAGYTTVENIWQTAFYLPEQNFACAVYLVGGNDLRVQNVEGLDPDFEGSHLRDQIRVQDMESQFGMPSKSELALELMVKELWAWFFPPPFASFMHGHVSSKYDPRLERLYRRNLKTIVAINKMHGVKTVFIPAFSNRAQIPHPRWVPFVTPDAVPQLLSRLGDIMVEVGRTENVDVLTGPTKVDWQDDDFVDWSHFSARGSRKFADAIGSDIRRLCVN